MSGAFDVVGIGLAAIDDLIRVAEYPPADSKVPIIDRVRRSGGLNATACVAAARLGSRTAYAGVVDHDEESRFVLDALEGKGVSTDHVCFHPGAGPVLSSIILDNANQTRTIFYDMSRIVGPDDDWLPRTLLGSTRVLLIDNFRIDLAIRAARAAREAGAAVVADFEGIVAPRLEELLRLVDHLILSSAFARTLTGEPDPVAAARALHAPGRTVVITCGADGSWHIPESSTEPIHQPALPVEAVDTNGCGDVFHGAYASALADGFDLPERVRRATVAAAVSATTPGGQEGIPDTATVTRLLEEYRNWPTGLSPMLSALRSKE
ncbi:MAG: PfkB family carbohydrate kinase [Aeromicrobium sp.]